MSVESQMQDLKEVSKLPKEPIPDGKLLVTAKKIMEIYEKDEFRPYIIYGGLGKGKSSYALQVLAQLYGDLEYYNWEALKSRVVFKPEDFILKCKKQKKKDIAIVWDDAGYWLFALDYYKAFVKSVAKYLGVARSDWAAIIFTTPYPEWIIHKVSSMPNLALGQIIDVATKRYRLPDGRVKLYRYRYAVMYNAWRSPDGKRSGVKTAYVDRFNATLPDEVFEWYKPFRDTYARTAKQLMDDELLREQYAQKMVQNLKYPEVTKEAGMKRPQGSYVAFCDICGSPVLLPRKPQIGEQILCKKCRAKFPEGFKIGK